jgi:hypothetical protein
MKVEKHAYACFFMTAVKIHAYAGMDVNKNILPLQQ